MPTDHAGLTFNSSSLRPQRPNQRPNLARNINLAMAEPKKCPFLRCTTTSRRPPSRPAIKTTDASLGEQVDAAKQALDGLQPIHPASRSDSLENAPEPQPAQLKPDPNEATSQEGIEVADSSSLLCHPGYVDQPCLSDIAAEHMSFPTHGACNDVYSVAQGTNQGLVYVSAHAMNTDYLESRDEYSNRQIQHQPNTPDTVAAKGLAEVRGKPNIPGKFSFSVPEEQLGQLQAEGMPLSGPRWDTLFAKDHLCKVPEHFVSHGIAKKHRGLKIPCEWDGCSRGVVRHNFVRHIREKHLGHVRPTIPKKISYRTS
ncbi:hypothetical protein EDD15DRAFT_2413145 [Pisolithus albus]|nr:hypothetical protein EDD15DRAFT_2413145 [Pisolithus albus]